jgi:hypothetical protein
MTTRHGPLGFFLLLVLLLVPAVAAAELVLPPGFKAEVYVSGDGYEEGSTRGARGIPSTSSLVFDHEGALYLARTGRRYGGGEGEELWRLYRIPAGGARLGPPSESRYLHGPPLRNSQVAAVRAGRELLVTAFDRERKVGVLYRMLDGRAELLAGGTPPAGTAPALKQPEGVATDAAGNLYVADREDNLVVRLGPTGRVLDPRYASVSRPRLLVMDDRDRLWVGADGDAQAPWQRGPGEIWLITPGSEPTRILRGPVPAGIALSPAAHLVVADRQNAQVFALTPEGRRVDLIGFTEGDGPRALVFAPTTAATSRAGFAGDLFLVVIRRGAWPVNEVVRISGPFDELIRQRTAP